MPFGHALEFTHRTRVVSPRASRRVNPRSRLFQARALRDDHEAIVRHEEALAVGLQIVANLLARRDLDVLVDDAPPEPRVAPVTISVTGCSTWMRVFISMK